MTDKLHYRIRGSSLPSHAACSRSWAVDHLKAARAEKVKKEDDNYKIGVVIGNQCHAAAERLEIAKLEGVPLKYGQVIDDQIAEFRLATKGKTIEYDNTTRCLGDAEIQIESLLTEFSLYVLPDLQPAFVELELEYRYSDLITVSCHLDLVDRLGSSGNIFTIGDHKFGHGDGTYQAQLGVYLLALEAQDWWDGEIPYLWLSHIQRVGPGAIQTAAQRIIYTRDQVLDAALFRLESIEREILQYEQCGTLWPFGPNPASMFCTENTCRAWGSDLCNQWTPKQQKEKRE